MISTTTQNQTLTTDQLSQKLHIKANTVRTKFCKDGHVFGIKPTKLPNGRLLWSSEAVDALLVEGRLA